MHGANNLDVKKKKDQTNEHIKYIWSQTRKAMKGPIVAIERVCNSVQHNYCTAIHLGQFSKS